MTAADILKMPYARVVLPDEGGTYTAEIFEFPGCIAVGDTAAEALAHLDDVASDWISTALEQGQDIPQPIEASDYSGKLVLRMSSGLHKRSTMCAEREGVSLNQFITTCLAEAVGERARPNYVVAQPALQAMASVTLQLLPLGGHFFGSPQAAQGIAVGGHRQQLATGGGTTVIGLPTSSWHQPQQEQRHG